MIEKLIVAVSFRALHFFVHLGFLTCRDADEKVNHHRGFIKFHCSFAKYNLGFSKLQC